LYTDEELQSILLHEKIHSQEMHSVDVIIAELFCAVFWFHPFIWLYKKAIT
jgi:beta-lactamase regulating signal transducer with metallopeptidase domain